MKIAPIIIHLRQQLPGLKDRVAGAAEFEAVEDWSRLAIPAMYVMLGEDTTETIARIHRVEQHLDERFSVIVVLDNKQDKRGQGAQEQVHAVKEALLGCLFNYSNHLPDAYLVEYKGSRQLQMDRARYFHQFDFSQTSKIGTADGYEPNLTDFLQLCVDWEVDGSTHDEPNPDAQDQITLPQDSK